MNWDRWGPVAGAILATGGIWTLLVKIGTPNFRKFVFDLISDEKDGVPILKNAINKCLDNELETIRTVADATDDLLGRMDSAELAIQVHSAESKKLAEAAERIPELTRILSEIKHGNETFGRRFEAAMEKFTNELAHVREGVARMEGKWDGIERRRRGDHRE